MNQSSGFVHHETNGVHYLTIEQFEKTGLVAHGFSTRLGGVSSGECSSLNLGFKKKDKKENVEENFKIICRAIGISPDSMVFTDQVHKDVVKRIDESDRGKGFTRNSDILETDGLITSARQVALVTFYADCVPLFFLDVKNRAIGLTHSGWRGTTFRIGLKTLEKMKENFNTSPSDCLVGIGPSIGKCCFEVDEPVALEFQKSFPNYKDRIITPKGEKFHIDLWECNRSMLLDAGVPAENISVAKTCTCCNKELFFSHRGDRGCTGSLAAFLMLK